MVSEAIDFRYILLDNYKKLKITEEELVVIFMIDHLIGQGNPFITADLLSLKMSYDVKTLDALLARLLQKGIIEYVSSNKKTVTTLNPLKKKLFREFQITLANDETKEKEVEVENIYSEFEKLLNRSLSPVEISKIREWISYGYTDKQIIDALKEALSKGKKSLRSVDKILLQWQARDDIEAAGITAVNKDWSQDIERTMEIAKAKWIDD